MPTPSSLFASAIPISSLKLAGIKHPPPHLFSSHSFSIPLPHLHGVSRVHAILHSFTYSLKPLTQASISIQPIPILLHATHNHVLPYPCVHPFNHTTKPVSLSTPSHTHHHLFSLYTTPHHIPFTTLLKYPSNPFISSYPRTWNPMCMATFTSCHFQAPHTHLLYPSILTHA